MPSPIHQGEIVPFTNGSGAAAPPSDFYPVEPGDAAPALSLRDFFDILRRRKLAAISAFALVIALGSVATLLTKPVYRTGARLLVEGRTNSFALSNTDDPLSSVFQPKAGRDVDTQVEILRSPMVLNRVFKQAQVPPGLVDLDVRRVDRTDVIEVTATSTSREGAQRVAAALPVVYEQDTRNDRLRDVSAALDFARDSLKTQNANLNRAELAIERFGKSSGVVNPSDEATAAVAAAAASRSDLGKAEVDYARARAQLASLTAQRRALSDFVDTPITTTNPQVQQLIDQLAALNSTRQQKLFLYKPTDDEVRQVDLQISDVKARLARTPRSVTATSRAPNPAVAELEIKIGDARATLDAAQNTLLPLRAQVSSQKGKLGHFNTIARREAQLLRDRDASAVAVKSLGEQVTQLTLRNAALGASGAPVTTMDSGAPAEKIAPRPLRNLLGAIFLGALLACGAALLQESLDDHVRDQDEARRLLHTSVLGYFPLVPGKGPRPILDLENPDRHLLEGFRVLRSNVQFALVNSPGQRILVTSSVPGEGKSYVATNLAVSMALNGHNVILVDADLHRPRVNETFNIPQSPGLSNVLIGQAKLKDCVREVGVPGLRVITAGVTPPNPTELLSSPMMDAVLDRLGKGANVVIFDSPPLLATADAQVLASKVDGVIYVMQLGRAQRSSIERSFELLRHARARVLGLVFNQMENQTSRVYQEYGEYLKTPVQSLLANGGSKGEDRVDSVILSPANGFKRKDAPASPSNTPPNGSSNGVFIANDSRNGDSRNGTASGDESSPL